MATAALTATFLAQVQGGDTGTQNVSITWAITSPLEIVYEQVLTQGAFNAVVLPSTLATLVVVIPPTTNTQAVTLKGLTGDTGTPLNVSLPTILAVPSGTSGLGLTLGAGSNQKFKFRLI